MNHLRNLPLTSAAMACCLLWAGFSSPNTYLDAARPGPALASQPPQALVGEWRVDLGGGYYKPLRITAIRENEMEGYFYSSGSQFRNSLVSANDSTLTIAFETRDRSTRYFTLARLDGDRLIGTTYAIERAFLTDWTAEKVE